MSYVFDDPFDAHCLEEATKTRDNCHIKQPVSGPGAPFHVPISAPVAPSASQMSQRAHFAIMCLQALISRDSRIFKSEIVITYAVDLADALITELGKKENV
jgi:hypothetical protein